MVIVVLPDRGKQVQSRPDTWSARAGLGYRRNAGGATWGLGQALVRATNKVSESSPVSSIILGQQTRLCQTNYHYILRTLPQVGNYQTSCVNHAASCNIRRTRGTYSVDPKHDRGADTNCIDPVAARISRDSFCYERPLPPQMLTRENFPWRGSRDPPLAASKGVSCINAFLFVVPSAIESPFFFWR